MRSTFLLTALVVGLGCSSEANVPGGGGSGGSTTTTGAGGTTGAAGHGGSTSSGGGNSGGANAGGGGANAGGSAAGGGPQDCTDDPNGCPTGYLCACGGPGPGPYPCHCGLVCKGDPDCTDPAQPVCCAGTCTDACTCFCD